MIYNSLDGKEFFVAKITLNIHFLVMTFIHMSVAARSTSSLVVAIFTGEQFGWGFVSINTTGVVII